MARRKPADQVRPGERDIEQSVRFTHAEMAGLIELVETGLYGDGVSEAVERIVARFLEGRPTPPGTPADRIGRLMERYDG